MPMPISMTSHLMSSASRQSAHAALLPKFYSPIPVSIAPYPYQSSFSSDQAAQMGLLSNIQAPASVYTGFPHLSSASGLPSIAQNPLFGNAGTHASASKKRPAQKQAPTKLQNNVAINQGSQLLSSTNKRQAQAGPPPKVQTELYESVRSKLRESLAASLAMVPDQQNKSQGEGKKSPKEAENTAPQAEEGTGPLRLTSTATDSSNCTNSSEALSFNEQNTKHNEDQDGRSEANPNENMSNQIKVSKDNVQEDQVTQASLRSETGYSTNPIVNDVLLQGHGLCWASDVDAGDSETIVNQDSKRPKLSHEEGTEKPKLFHEEGTEKPKLLDEEVIDDLKESFRNAENLAYKIETELFKLFGGVNKKYKERARSLLFNLKDRSNPELRERVLSGDIAPERLCSMTAEELASKELSEWRLAKAEELAQMVVLPDSEVDMRRLVKKTHKGEFQVVELEQDDSISVEVAVGETVFSRVPSKVDGIRTRSKSDQKEARSSPHETKVSEGSPLPEKGGSGVPKDSSNMDTLLNEKADFMQDLMVDDELKDTELLPPIVSLDEFMQALDSEPPFDNLSMDTNLPEKNADMSEPEMDPDSDSSEPKLDPALDKLTPNLDSSEVTFGSKLSPAEDSKLSPPKSPKLSLPDIPEVTAPEVSKLSPSKTDLTGPQEIAISNTLEVDTISRPDNDRKSGSEHAVTSTSLADIKPRTEYIWEGLLQLNISTLSTVIGFFKSGERTSTQEWPSFLEIKGRVRLDAFEKFLQELPHSRSRAIMIAQFCWKEGSHESGRLNMIETANSYIADQRVGFSEPAPGVELYFCPPHAKTMEMLERHLPKELTDALHSTVKGLIGVVVWRRPHVTTISPRLSSHHKHGSSTKKQSGSRRQQQNVMNSSGLPSSRSTHPRPPPADELIDDVPPGFGPGSARDEDDLPEFDFHSNSQQKGHQPHAASLPPPPARPVEQMRELIQRYGKGENERKSGISAQPWNDDDDIPEWQPNQNNQQTQLQPQQQLPPPPPPPQQTPQLQLPTLTSQTHNNFQQQTMQQPQQAFLVNQNLMPQQPQMQQQHLQQLAPLAVAYSMPLQPQFHPQMGFMQGQQNQNVNVNMNMNPGWQQQGGQLWSPLARGPTPAAEFGVNMPINSGGMVMQPCHLNFSGQPVANGQFYGVPAFGAVPLQNGMMGWRPDVPRNNG